MWGWCCGEVVRNLRRPGVHPPCLGSRLALRIISRNSQATTTAPAGNGVVVVDIHSGLETSQALAHRVSPNRSPPRLACWGSCGNPLSRRSTAARRRRLLSASIKPPAPFLSSTPTFSSHTPSTVALLSLVIHPFPLFESVAARQDCRPNLPPGLDLHRATYSCWPFSRLLSHLPYPLPLLHYPD